MKSAMKRDSSHYKDCREKPFGARLYRKNDEPVLELYTDQRDLEGYTGRAHYSVGVFDVVIQVLIEVHTVKYGRTKVVTRSDSSRP